MAIQTMNPATGELHEIFDALSADEVDARIARAEATFAAYRRTTFDERAAWMRAAADLLDTELHDIAVTMTTEMGKTVTSARAEAAKCAKGMRFYAEQSDGPGSPRAASRRSSSVPATSRPCCATRGSRPPP